MDRSLRKRTKKVLILAGLLTGLLPLWHTHSLIGLILIIPVYIFYLGIKNFLPFLYLSIPLSILGILWHLKQILTSRFLSLNIGWIVGEEGQLLFWFSNLSIFIILLPLGFIVLSRNQKLFYLPSLIILLAINLFQFQPLAYDNYKLIMLWHAFSSIIVAKYLIYLLQTHSFGKIISPLSFLVLVLSGFILLYANYISSYKLYSQEDLQLSEWAGSNIPSGSTILSGQQHNQFLTLAGRKTLLGYPGYLWTQGTDYASRENDLKMIYQGNQQLLNNYRINYIIIGPNEQKIYQPNVQFFDTNFPLIKQTKNYKIYKTD